MPGPTLSEKVQEISSTVYRLSMMSFAEKEIDFMTNNLPQSVPTIF